jgi:hypothetical protein
MSLTRAPSPAAFADAWVTAHSAALRAAAGQDGRLTAAAARRLEAAGGPSSLAGDNVESFLARTGQQSVGVDKFIREERARLVHEASAVAGPNHLVSRTEAERLPVDARQDFFALRGRTVNTPPAILTGQALIDAVRSQVLAAFAPGAAPVQRISGSPWQVLGHRPVVEDLQHPASNTRFRVYVAERQVFASRASSAPSPLVGWYRIGPAPTA